jgi:hypothetical protein
MVVETHFNIVQDLKTRLGMKSLQVYNRDMNLIKSRIDEGRFDPTFGPVVDELTKVSGVVPFGTCSDKQGISLEYNGTIHPKIFGEILSEIAKNYNMKAYHYEGRYVIRPPKNEQK